jgi:TM2 domain-containing membrane protein YozV
MKDKNVAGILALFLGWAGVHRFYLGQTGLGVFYLLFFWFPVIWLVAFIDALVFLSMDKSTFDRRYNKDYFSDERYLDTDFVRRDRDRNRRERSENRQERRDLRRERSYETRQRPAASNRPSPARRGNPYKISGIKKYKDYDYDGAIEDFLKALDLEPKDVATHFNLACAYSLNEKADKAFYHLDRAVANGFNDFQKIKNHDAFAYLRIQDDFESFEKNGFRLSPAAGARPVAGRDATAEQLDALEGHPDLLEQLQRLGELRERGLLTEDEFAMQKKKLLS